MRFINFQPNVGRGTPHLTKKYERSRSWGKTQVQHSIDNKLSYLITYIYEVAHYLL
ncbi:MAG: hypothetical protein ACRC2S_06320 [Waterburya sp.]